VAGFESSEGNWALTVPAKKLIDLVDTLPADEHVRLDPNLSKQSLKVRCGPSVEVNVNGIAAEEFPPFPSMNAPLTTRLDTAILRTAIRQVAYACAKEEARPALNGVCFQFSTERLIVQAADGSRCPARTCYRETRQQ
jgi:DNA polymerase-3 subunit beta